MENATEDKNPRSVEMIEAKCLFDDLKVAVNDLSHYGTPRHVIESVQIVHDNLVRLYNKTYFPEGPEPQETGAAPTQDADTQGGDEKPPGDAVTAPTGTRERKPRHNP